MGTTEGEEREKGTGEISETIAENFLQINLSHQTTEEVQRTPKQYKCQKKTQNQKSPIPRYIIFKLQKSQRQSLKHQRKTHRTYRREQRREVPRVSPQKPCKPEESGMKYLKKKKLLT